MGRNGLYGVYEGAFLAGKTTQLFMLYEYLSKRIPDINFIVTREPGGTDIGTELRKIIQGDLSTLFGISEKLTLRSEVLGYAMDRAQHVDQKIWPALLRGDCVFSDRSFLTSMDFQVFGYGSDLRSVWEINKYAVNNVMPDFVVHLHLSVEEILRRQSLITKVERSVDDKHETNSTEFIKAIVEGYFKVEKFLKKERPEIKWITIDAEGAPEVVFERIRSELEPLIVKHYKIT